MITLQNKIIFQNKYCGEDLCDVDGDIYEAFCDDCNPLMDALPSDGCGFTKGVFKITIEWSEEDS